MAIITITSIILIISHVYYVGLTVDSGCVGGGGGGGGAVSSDRSWPSCPIPDTRWRSCLTVLPFFALKIPAWSSTTNSSKFTGHVSPIHQYPHWVSKPIYDWPTCARDPIQIHHIWAAHVGSRIKKDTKAYSTYKSWIIFLGKTALNFPKAATKKSNDQQKQGNNRDLHPAALSSLRKKTIAGGFNMSSYVDSSNFRQTSETTSPNSMFSYDLSGHRSSHYEDVNVNGIFTCPVPTTSVEREEMKTSLRGNADTPLPSGGPQITMISGSSAVDASGLGYGGALLGRGADRDPERSAKSGGNKSQEGERNAESAQSAKRHANAGQRQDAEPRPQIYPWMTKLHMSHGKVCLFSEVRLRCLLLFTLYAATLLFARSTFPSWVL